MARAGRERVSVRSEAWALIASGKDRLTVRLIARYCLIHRPALPTGFRIRQS
jgi:hypothetical protein